MKKNGKTEGSSFTYGVEDKDIARTPVYREKQIVKNVSQGHTGPGGAENPSDTSGNREEAIRQNRYDGI